MDVLAKAKELTGGEGFDLAIETAGTEITTNQAIQVVRKGIQYRSCGIWKDRHDEYDDEPGAG